jgi:Integrase core domain/Integrase zinc binding domain
MFATLGRTFFWPRMAADVYDIVRQCDACARNLIAENKHTNVMELFPANGPMESVSMDILGPLPRTIHGNRFLLVIADLFTKVTITVLLRTVTALVVSKAFCDRWVYVYGPPISRLTDNGPQFTAKFFQAVCTELGVKKTFTTAYHPQTNGQLERSTGRSSPRCGLMSANARMTGMTSRQPWLMLTTVACTASLVWRPLRSYPPGRHPPYLWKPDLATRKSPSERPSKNSSKG